MPNCDKCIWSIRSGHCVLLECKFVSYEDARRIMEEKERKDEKTVCSMSMTLEEAIKHAERVAAEQSAKAKTIESNPWGEKSKVRSKIQDCLNCAEEHRQLAAWLRELQERRKAPEVVFCKDCRKHNVKVGFDENFHTVWKEDACPLVDWRGKAKEHEFDYQYCAFAERRTE